MPKPKGPLRFSTLKPAKRVRTQRTKPANKDLPPMMLTPEFLETEAGMQHVEALDDRLNLHLYLFKPERDEDSPPLSKREGSSYMRRVIDNMSAIHDYMPWKYDKQLPKEGGWIRVNNPPSTLITVPPFSQWYAVPDPTPVDPFGFCRHRARIETPRGPLWIMPHEYVTVKNIHEWLGRESEGCYLHYLDPDNVGHSSDALHYIMSRGITRRDGMTMLLQEINSPHFCWFEFRPEYAAQFGIPWPSESRCPFAMRPEDDEPEEEEEPQERAPKDIPPPYRWPED